MTEIELEKTYLAKYIPDDLTSFPYVDLVDIYMPKNTPHPHLRLRKRGEQYSITRKTQTQEQDASKHIEETIVLTEDEFAALSVVEGFKTHKARYKYKWQGQEFEIDVFLDNLAGLVLVDKEFNTEKELNNFQIPEFCLDDVTDEELLAGGMLAGKKYLEISNLLDKFNYKPLRLE